MTANKSPIGPAVAFVDESESDAGRDPHTYLLGAVVLSAGDLDDVRHELRKLKLPRERKLHWTKESDRSRLRIASALADLPVTFHVAVHEGHLGERPERRRRICLETLLFALEDHGVDEVTAESRGPADRRDRDAVTSLRRSRAVTSIRMRHVGGPVEPLLWAADAVCGALVRSRLSDDRFMAGLWPTTTVLPTRPSTL